MAAAGTLVCRDGRIRAHMAGAGIHAADSRIGLADRAPDDAAQGSAAPGPRSRRRRTGRRACATRAATAAERSAYQVDTPVALQARDRPARPRSQGRGAAADFRADAGRRVRPSPGARPVSADAARSADGSARGRNQRQPQRTRCARRQAGAARFRQGGDARSAEGSPGVATADHRRTRSRARRRGSGSDRPPRHPAKKM